MKSLGHLWWLLRLIQGTLTSFEYVEHLGSLDLVVVSAKAVLYDMWYQHYVQSNRGPRDINVVSLVCFCKVPTSQGSYVVTRLAGMFVIKNLSANL